MLSRKVEECYTLAAEMALDVGDAANGGLVPRGVQHDVRAPLRALAAVVAPHQGLTLVHFPAQRKHILLDTLGA
jgi:hypothetical protein